MEEAKAQTAANRQLSYAAATSSSPTQQMRQQQMHATKDWLREFRLTGVASDHIPDNAPDKAKQLAALVVKTVASLKDSGNPLKIDVCDVKRVGGSPRQGQRSEAVILFEVRDRLQAMDIRRLRPQLKGQKIVIGDQLSPEEYATYKRLRPKYLAAKAEGKQARFKRAQLFVDGQEVRVE